MGKVEINMSKLRGEIFVKELRLVEERAEEVLEEAQRESPVGNREYHDEEGAHPGLLRRSHELEKAARGIGYHIVANTRYAIHVFDGDGPEGPRTPNRWLVRALDIVGARHAGTRVRGS
jgi:hypothetical protein